MHHFVTEMCTYVHISVTKWSIVGWIFVKCIVGSEVVVRQFQVVKYPSVYARRDGGKALFRNLLCTI